MGSDSAMFKVLGYWLELDYWNWYWATDTGCHCCNWIASIGKCSVNVLDPTGNNNPIVNVSVNCYIMEMKAATSADFFLLKLKMDTTIKYEAKQETTMQGNKIYIIWASESNRQQQPQMTNARWWVRWKMWISAH